MAVRFFNTYKVGFAWAIPGGAAGCGIATIDFGSGGSVSTTVAVTGQTGITTSAHVEAWILGGSTTDNNFAMHAWASQFLRVIVDEANITNGTGFTIYVDSATSDVYWQNGEMGAKTFNGGALIDTTDWQNWGAIHPTVLIVTSNTELRARGIVIVARDSICIDAGSQIHGDGKNSTDNNGGSLGNNVCWGSRPGDGGNGGGAASNGANAEDWSGRYMPGGWYNHAIFQGGAGGNGTVNLTTGGTGSRPADFSAVNSKNPTGLNLVEGVWQISSDADGNGGNIGKVIDNSAPGGGGGGGGATTAGGGGGSGGHSLTLAAPIIYGAGSVHCRGGNGGPAAAGNGGGGGGGSGGILRTFHLPGGWQVTGTVDVAGGTAGAGSGTGVNGTAGSPGLWMKFDCR